MWASGMNALTASREVGWCGESGSVHAGAYERIMWSVLHAVFSAATEAARSYHDKLLWRTVALVCCAFIHCVSLLRVPP